AVRWALEARIARRASDLRNAIETAGTLYAPSAIHDVRIAIKKLRYAVEVRGTARPRNARASGRLKTTQELLGRLHDLEILVGWARRAQSGVAPDLARWRDMAVVIHQLDTECRGLHRRYMRVRAALLSVATGLCGQRRGPARLTTRRAG